MFVNLVRIGLIRLFKGSRFVIGAVIALLMMLMLIMFRELILVEGEMINADVDLALNEPMAEQYAGFTVGIEAGLLFCMYSTVCFVCDYYKNRQKINIEGMIRSRAKLCMSEICALFIFSLCVGLFGPVVSFIGLLRDGLDRVLILEYPLAFLAMTISGGVMIFTMCLPIFCCSKIFRKKSVSMAVYGVCYIFYMFAILFFASYSAGFRSSVEAGTYVAEVEATPALVNSQVVACFITPGSFLFEAASGTPSDVPVPIIVAATATNILFWSVVSSLASRRYQEI